MKFAPRNGIGLIAGVILGLTISLSYGVFAERNTGGSTAPLPLEDLRTFTDVYTRIKRDYVEAVDDKKLIESAIRGMLAGLDPHSAWLNEQEYKDLQIGTTGEFGGLGIEVGMEDGFVKVIAPIDDTPASRAGIRAGDLIIRLDETPVKGLTLNEAVNLMRGQKGTPITLTVVREEQDKPLRITIVRDVIRVKSVRSEVLEPGFVYVRITNFQSKTAQNLVEEIGKLEKENGPIRGLILDLRNNPGGVLTASVGVSDAFLEEGLIVYTEGRVADSQSRYSASPGDVIKGAPMVVLINEGSASASEIVAGALQDHRRAVLMGSRSFGKGSVQTILPVTDATALKLTTARYYTPSGRSIQAEGIEPDIRLERLTVSESPDEESMKPVKEADLTGHLGNGKDVAKPAKSEDKAGATNALAKRDYALYEALNLLKGLDILGAGSR